jgi:hypothetical protein
MCTGLPVPGDIALSAGGDPIVDFNVAPWNSISSSRVHWVKSVKLAQLRMVTSHQLSSQLVNCEAAQQCLWHQHGVLISELAIQEFGHQQSLIAWNHRIDVLQDKKRDYHLMMLRTWLIRR